DRFDVGAVAAGECDRELCEGGAARARADRSDRLRPGSGAADYRYVRDAVRSSKRRDDRTGQGQGASAVSADDAANQRTGDQAMTAGALAIPLARRTVSPWLVAVAVVIPTFMEVLDTTIANVALRYIAGGLSAPFTDSEWVITSYLAANAII